MTTWDNGISLPGRGRIRIERGKSYVGCCWFLTGPLFFGSVMNLYWIGGITNFVLLEKTIPMGHWMSHLVGVALMIWEASFSWCDLNVTSKF